jgi:hypothetical protein
MSPPFFTRQIRLAGSLTSQLTLKRMLSETFLAAHKITLLLLLASHTRQKHYRQISLDEEEFGTRSSRLFKFENLRVIFRNCVP